MSTLKEYRYIGTHADELDGGQPLSPGQYTGPIESPDNSHNQILIDEGYLLEVPKGTRDKVAKIDRAAVGLDPEPESNDQEDKQ